MYCVCANLRVFGNLYVLCGCVPTVRSYRTRPYHSGLTAVRFMQHVHMIIKTQGTCGRWLSVGPVCGVRYGHKATVAHTTHGGGAGAKTDDQMFHEQVL